MCGIVGYVGPREASDVLIGALKRLEYRGYDSAGVAALDGEGIQGIEVRRAVGKLHNLERLLGESPLPGQIGIGHTRWATHGRPSQENAHPHRAGNVVLIHNGIIENYLELRAELVAAGRKLWRQAQRSFEDEIGRYSNGVPGGTIEVNAATNHTNRFSTVGIETCIAKKLLLHIPIEATVGDADERMIVDRSALIAWSSVLNTRHTDRLSDEYACRSIRLCRLKTGQYG